MVEVKVVAERKAVQRGPRRRRLQQCGQFCGRWRRRGHGRRWWRANDLLNARGTRLSLGQQSQTRPLPLCSSSFRRRWSSWCCATPTRARSPGSAAAASRCATSAPTPR
eukprot:4760385-Prymnesium_polylepis.1